MTVVTCESVPVEERSVGPQLGFEPVSLEITQNTRKA